MILGHGWIDETFETYLHSWRILALSYRLLTFVALTGASWMRASFRRRRMRLTLGFVMATSAVEPDPCW